MSSELSTFSQGVIKIIQGIPKGKVVSYGQVALMLGKARAARQVGWTLRRLESADMPWWRVVNNQGHISITSNWLHDRDEQRDLLRHDGVEVGADYTINMAKYRFQSQGVVL